MVVSCRCLCKCMLSANMNQTVCKSLIYGHRDGYKVSWVMKMPKNIETLPARQYIAYLHDSYQSLISTDDLDPNLEVASNRNHDQVISVGVMECMVAFTVIESTLACVPCTPNYMIEDGKLVIQLGEQVNQDVQRWISQVVHEFKDFGRWLLRKIDRQSVNLVKRVLTSGTSQHKTGLGSLIGEYCRVLVVTMTFHPSLSSNHYVIEMVRRNLRVPEDVSEEQLVVNHHGKVNWRRIRDLSIIFSRHGSRHGSRQVSQPVLKPVVVMWDQVRTSDFMVVPFHYVGGKRINRFFPSGQEVVASVCRQVVLSRTHGYEIERTVMKKSRLNALDEFARDLEDFERIGRKRWMKVIEMEKLLKEYYWRVKSKKQVCVVLREVKDILESQDSMVSTLRQEFEEEWTRVDDDTFEDHSMVVKQSVRCMVQLESIIATKMRQMEEWTVRLCRGERVKQRWC